MAAETAKAPVATPATPAPDDIASLQVSLPQMLDLALGTPEVKGLFFFAKRLI